MSSPALWARELHRIISATVRDMFDAYRIQAQAGPVADQALEQVIFRGAQPVLHSLAPYPPSNGLRFCRASCA